MLFESKPPRSADRIEPLLRRLAAAWSQCPDLRLGQLIDAAVYEYFRRFDGSVVNVEDDDLILAIERLVSEKPYYVKEPK